MNISAPRQSGFTIRPVADDHCDGNRRAQAPNPRSKRIYQSVVDDYDLAGEPHAREVLRLALEALDAADTARKIVEAEGMVYENRFGEPRAHPAVAIERDGRLAVARLFAS